MGEESRRPGGSSDGRVLFNVARIQHLSHIFRPLPNLPLVRGGQSIIAVLPCQGETRREGV